MKTMHGCEETTMSLMFRGGFKNSVEANSLLEELTQYSWIWIPIEEFNYPPTGLGDMRAPFGLMGL